MIIQLSAFHAIVLSVLISFGFFGSLSHVFSFVLIIYILFQFFKDVENRIINYRETVLYFSLSGCFFIFFFNGILHAKFQSSLISISPMYPIPIIGLLILFHQKAIFSLSAKQLAIFSRFLLLSH